MVSFGKDLQYYKFCAYGFLKNLRFFEPFLILFFLEKGLVFFQIGTLYAIRELATNILEVPTGVVADVMGRRRTMIFSFLFYIFSFLIFFYSASYAAFVVAMLLFAVGEAFRTGVHKAMIFTYLKIKGWEDQKVHYYGHTRSWSQLGSAVSALLAAAIVLYTGEYQTVFAYATIPYVLDLGLLASYPAMLDGRNEKRKKESILLTFKTIIRSFYIAFKDILLLKAVNNISLYSGYYKAVKDYLQPILQALAVSLPIMVHLNKQQRSSILIGGVYFFIFLLTSFASRHSGKLAARFSNLSKPLNYTLLIGLVIGLLAGFFYDLGWTILAVGLYILIYLMENLRKPIGVGFFAEKVEGNILASALSVQSQVGTLWAALIAIVLGVLTDTLGIGLTLVVTSSLLLLAAPVFWLKEKH